VAYKSTAKEPLINLFSRAKVDEIAGRVPVYDVSKESDTSHEALSPQLKSKPGHTKKSGADVWAVMC
jgi:hypothetical protein